VFTKDTPQRTQSTQHKGLEMQLIKLGKFKIDMNSVKPLTWSDDSYNVIYKGEIPFCLIKEEDLSEKLVCKNNESPLMKFLSDLDNVYRYFNQKGVTFSNSEIKFLNDADRYEEHYNYKTTMIDSPIKGIYFMETTFDIYIKDTTYILDQSKRKPKNKWVKLPFKKQKWAISGHSELLIFSNRPTLWKLTRMSTFEIIREFETIQLIDDVSQIIPMGSKCNNLFQ